MEQREFEEIKPARKNRKRRKVFLLFIIILIIIAVFISFAKKMPEAKVKHMGNLETPSWVDAQIINIDGHSRTGAKLTGINDIVIHYVGNPGTSAQANHDYFANTNSVVSSHYVVGLDGEVIQCIPLDERSAASNNRNSDTISIEVCHPDKSGKFNDSTYQSLVKLTAWLCDEAGLNENHIIRHYDVTGKICPKYFVEHEDAWEQFKADVKAAI
jgi:N-acetylmuramoyl-L-alanine amidase CwlA